MRKNHHGKKDRLVKRVFALCLALAVICTCLVPVFATEYKEVVDFGGDEAAYPDDEFAGFGGDEAAGFGDDFPAVDDGEPREVYDEGEAAYPDEREVVDYSGGNEATRPVEGGEEEATRPAEGEGGEDNLDGGPNVKETEWGTVIEYGPSSSTGTDPEPETQWSGEDDVVEKPDDKVVVSGDEIKKLQDMVVYRFWLRELNTLDLQDITAQAQINNMTESEYLARNGEVLWNLYFIQAVPRAETIADYSSYIENPSSNRDPKGELRQFDYWYTLDEFGNRVRLNLTDPTSNILDDKTTTVNVYAAWKDGTVGSDEEEDVDHEDLVDKNPVPVDLETKASASYEDEEGNTKSVNLPVEVKNLPSAAHSLSVIHMGDDDMESFYESHEDSFGEMMPILGLKISPKNAKGNTVQPAKGQKATVTVSGLDALPYMVKATAGELKVLHQTADGSVETLDVLSYQNGTLTFETSSFSPFVIASVNGYGTDTMAVLDDITLAIGGTYSVTGSGSDGQLDKHNWSVTKSDGYGQVRFSDNSSRSTTITGVTAGTVVVTHQWKFWYDLNWRSESFTITVGSNLKKGDEYAQVYFLYDMTKNANQNDTGHWRGPLKVSGVDAVVNTQNATWEGGLNGNDTLKDKNIKQNLGQYIQCWPDGKTGTTWELDETVRSLTIWDSKTKSDRKIEDVVYDNFLGKLKEVGLTDEQLQKIKVSNIKIALEAYKISRSNSTVPDKHIDCNIIITCTSSYTAKFKVKLPTDTVYETIDTKLYLNDQKVSKYQEEDSENPKAPATYTDKDGVVWVFDGWYPENKVGDGPDESKGIIPDKQWPYEVKDWQLTNNNGDRVVNFYAHYKKATSNVTITKQVTGLLGDTNKEFTFNVSITQKNGADCSADVKAWKGSTEVSLNGFTLKHNETVTLENVPIGATITVTEVTPGEHYNVSATGHSDEQNGRDSVAFTYVAAANTATASDAEEADLMLLSIDEGTAVDADAVALTDATDKTVPNNAITVTNRATLKPDTGVLLDTLPYIVILAVVAGGVALLMLRKRRKEDD